MRGREEDGYILASAIAVLLAISIVAATLVSTSVDGLRRVQRMEADARSEAALKSALLLTTSQLAQDPRRRQIRFDARETTIDVLGQQVGVRISWENAKLDINRADPKALDEALHAAGFEENERSALRQIIERRRSQMPIALLEDVVPAPEDRECLYSILTVFGGQTEYRAGNRIAEDLVGRPAAGSRLAIDLWLADQPALGKSAVVIMTGDPAAPAKVLDWRQFRAAGGEQCREN
jgi:hypothetical protein